MRRLPYLAGLLFAVLTAACAVEQKTPAADGKAVVDAYVHAWNHHDFAALDTILAPDAIHEDPAQSFQAKGPKEEAEFLRKTVSAEPDFKWTIKNSVQDGNIVASEWTWTSTYTGPDPGGKLVANKHLSGRGTSFAEVENGKIKRFTDYYDQASFFR